MDKISNFYTRHKKLFLYALIFILIVLCLLIIYLLERYIIYNIIYYLLNFIHILVGMNHLYIFYFKFEIFFIIIYLHIILARLIILSIIFPHGGFFKKMLIFYDYISFTSLISDYIIDFIDSLNKNDIDKIESYIKEFNRFLIKDENNNIPKKNFIQYEKDLNEALELYYNYKITNNNEIKENLIQYLTNMYKGILNVESYSLKDILYTYNGHEALLLMENYLIKRFERNKVEKINISKNFDIYFISPKIIGKYNDILTIFCNQNCLCCEFYSVFPDNLEFYLQQLNCNIIIWNYKGFGLRKGFTTFGNIDKDVVILANYIKINFNKYKIIIHGTSIGGYSSIKLMQNLTDYENAVLICDRTFGDIKYIVETFDKYKILYTIYNILFHKFLFKYSNIENYISLPMNKKIILYDANDEVIPYNPSSLVFCLTKKYYYEIVIPKLSKYKEYINLIKNAKDYEIELNQICEINTINNFDKDGKKLLNKLNKKIKIINEFLMFFVVFGCPFNSYNEINPNINKFNSNYMNIPFIMKNIYTKNKYLFPNKIFELLSIINYLYIKFNFNCDLKDDDILKFNYFIEDKDKFMIDENSVNGLKKYFGFIHRLFCGHDGKLQNNDKLVIKDFLKYNKFI